MGTGAKFDKVSRKSSKFEMLFSDDGEIHARQAAGGGRDGGKGPLHNGMRGGGEGGDIGAPGCVWLETLVGGHERKTHTRQAQPPSLGFRIFP